MTKKMCKNNTHTQKKVNFVVFRLYAVLISNRKRVDVLRFIFFGWKGETSCISYSFSSSRDNFSSWPEGTSGSSRVCVCGVLLCCRKKKKKKKKRRRIEWMRHPPRPERDGFQQSFSNGRPFFFSLSSLLFFLSSGSLSLLHFFFYFKGSPQRNIPLFLFRLLRLHLYQQEEMRGEKFPFFCASLSLSRVANRFISRFLSSFFAFRKRLNT
jgi:hypothetical protein